MIIFDIMAIADINRAALSKIAKVGDCLMIWNAQMLCRWDSGRA